MSGKQKRRIKESQISLRIDETNFGKKKWKMAGKVKAFVTRMFFSSATLIQQYFKTLLTALTDGIAN